MEEKLFDSMQAVTKTVASVGTAVGVFSFELLLLERAVPFHGAASLTSAFSKAGKLVGTHTMKGGLVGMIASASLAGQVAENAVDHLFGLLRERSDINAIPPTPQKISVHGS